MESDCAAKELAKVNSYLQQGSRVGCGAIHGMYMLGGVMSISSHSRWFEKCDMKLQLKSQHVKSEATS